MSLLSRHLEQIQLSSEAIATLPFPPPKIFTNALLSTSDITSLIRDTEPHERALFSVPPPPLPATSSTPYIDPKIASSNRRQTVFNVTQGEVTAGNATGSRAPRRNTAVAAVLGAELHNEVRKTEGKGDVDIEVLLRGVEKLNGVYEVKGTTERVRALRERWRRVQENVSFYEAKVDKQTLDLERMNRGERWESEGDEEGNEEDGEDERDLEVEVTDEDLRREEEEIRLLELKKKALEERVRGMEKDLGALLR